MYFLNTGQYQARLFALLFESIFCVIEFTDMIPTKSTTTVTCLLKTILNPKLLVFEVMFQNIYIFFNDILKQV